MNSKIMFAGGSTIMPQFYSISRASLISHISSLKNLLEFTNLLNFDFYSQDDMLGSIASIEDYFGKNVDLQFIQSEILKAFDNESAFYFQLYDEGQAEFIAFKQEVTDI